MLKKIGWVALAGALVGLALSGASQTITGEIQQVLVRNFPELQEVKGTVRVDGPIAHSAFLRREAVIVSPARRGDVTNLTPAGVVETAGFTGVVLSIEGEVRDSHFDPGTVGAVLVPDEPPVLDALRVDGRIEFPLEVVAGVEPQKGSRFSSEPTVRPIAFPRYRVFLYNGSNKSVEANLYVYLTN